ncbi:GHKL domain-containing protein [Chakrabartyella piscis]|uniref:GHKL domain-containing protein n=1 Tax=Chakrabartyella piscis TaxID=2918914 RepID=UPI002958C046|nr:GHKL domain-containing protein [Chakrabartyella piscis]
MGKLKSVLHLFGVVILLIPLVYLFFVTSSFGFFGEWKETPATEITSFSAQIDGVTEDITLPYTFYDDTEQVILTTQLNYSGYKRLYMKSVYSPLRVYANDELLYEYGTEGTYPPYLNDPPVQTSMVDLPNESTITLRMEYTHPSTREDLTIEPPLVGTYPSIFTALLNQQEPLSLLFIFFLGFGLLLLCIGLFVRAFEHQGVSFIWLGLIVLCCGIWGFGEYDITCIFIHNASILYLLGFVGIYYLPVPIHFYFHSIIAYRNPKPITICGYVCLLVAVINTLLQATSVLSFYNGLPYFMVVTFLSFLFGFGYTIYEWRIYDNHLAKQFILPWLIIIASILIEVSKFIQKATTSHGTFAQIGLLIFILANSIIGGFLIRKSLALKEQNRFMEQEYKLMEVQVAEQQRYHHLLMETRQTLRQQRHDLHHQMTVIRSLAKEGNIEKLNRHMDTLDAQIPEELQIFCDNIAVNTVVAYYAAKAKSNNITLNIDLVVPEPVEQIGDNSLCVIFGNIMENAIEACGRMSDSGKFITLTSYLKNGMLVILQKNSFEGPLHPNGDKFFSSKREEFGIGLSSVQSVARKYGGNATFTTDGRVFQSAIYVRIEK